MKLFRRRARGTAKEAALAEARKATASLRRRNAEAERYRTGKQDEPAYEITAGPWVEGGD